MYMITFATLVIALLGMYTQIYSKQALGVLNQQAAAASQLIYWHDTAISLATKLVPSGNLTATGCLMTNVTPFTASVPTQSNCTTSSGYAVYVGLTAPTGVNNCTVSSPPCWTGLPLGYNTTPYTFYSLAYTANSHYYVLTYLPPPPTAGDNYNLGFVCLPGIVGASTTCNGGQVQLSVGFANFMRQLSRNPNLSPVAYGTITSTGTLTTALAPGAGASTYAVPTTGVPTGSIGLITQILPCTTC